MTLYRGSRGTLLFTNIYKNGEAPFCYISANNGYLFETEFIFRFSDWTRL